MSLVARQFSNPRGLLGWLVGRGMARSNGEFSRWTALQIQQHMKQPPRRIMEIGPGPGIGLEELLRRFPAAQVWGVDRSSEMLRQSRGRNREAVEAGRLSLVCGEVAIVRDVAPLDLVAANHVLYFWREPEQVLTTVREGLGPGGMVALGYQFRQNMPPMAQKHFPPEGFRLYDSEREIEAVLVRAGFAGVSHYVKTAGDRVQGRLSLATTDSDSAIVGRL